MSIESLQFVSHVPPLRELSPLAQILIVEGAITPQHAAEAEATAGQSRLRLAEILTANYGVSALTIADAFSTLYQTARIDPRDLPPERNLVAAYGPARAIQTSILPWRRMGETTVILTYKPDQFDRHLPDLASEFAGARMAITTRDQLEKTVIELFGDHLSHAAEHKTPSHMSSRTWRANRAFGLGLTFLLGLSACMIAFPSVTFSTFCTIAIAILLFNTGLKIAVLVANRQPQPSAQCASAAPERLPKITLLVPLFRETDITDHLLARLREIDYPVALLDVLLVTERDDKMTMAALGKTTLPTWMRPLIVLEGSLRTKPRALNFALDFAQGSIIGVYDAEDAPAPDQLRVVAAHFANCGPKVACLQGILDYYNTSTNWLTRCFTVEYATWFRVVLPGLEKLGLVVPLGGTTLFFRREVLENLGGWDAHNVTEDADLGVRLARAGYRTELIGSVTQEEANGRFWPWVKQRSRWLKGYAITYAVHMRAPRQLWRDLGPKRFLGVQLLFVGTLAQFVLAPLLWSFWLIPFGFPHPFITFLPPVWFWTLVGVFFASEVISLIIAAIALRAAGKTWLIKWTITLQFYFPLAAIAAYKGLLELAWKPFYWDKTMHGVLLPKGATAPTPPPARPASAL